MTYDEKINGATKFLLSNIGKNYAKTAIIFGSGLGGHIANFVSAFECSFNKIPHFPTSKLTTQTNTFKCGFWNGKQVIMLHGRVHWYEGFSAEEVVFGIRLLKELGVKNIILTGIIGYIGRAKLGSLFLIKDHINLIPDNPLRGQNSLRWGDRYPDMFETYDRNLMTIAKAYMKDLDIPFKTGVLAAVAGPNLETKAEYKALKRLGAKGVSMSTVPEAIAAVQQGSKVLGLSIISDLCDPRNLKPANIDELIRNSKIGREYLLTALELIVQGA